MASLNKTKKQSSITTSFKVDFSNEGKYSLEMMKLYNFLSHGGTSSVSPLISKIVKSIRHEVLLMSYHGIYEKRHKENKTINRARYEIICFIHDSI